MSRIEWTIAAIRIFCVWVLIEMVLAIPYTFGTWNALSGGDTLETDASAIVGVAAVGFLLPLLGAAIFWILSRPIAKFIWRDLPRRETVATPLTSQGILQAAIITLGIYLVAVTVPSLVEVVLAEVAKKQTFDVDADLATQVTGQLLGLLLQLLLGLALVFKGVGLANFLHSIRQAGLSGK